MRFNIVLVEPEIPQNTGNVARTCACTGAALHLVGPMGFEIDDRKLKRAGLDYWDKLDITMYPSLDDFFARNPGGEFFYFSSKASINYTQTDYPPGCFIVFGKETKGLPKSLLDAEPERFVRIPMLNDLRCLNLSNAVAVGAYEVLRQNGFTDLV